MELAQITTLTKNNIVEKAYKIAEKLHKGQFREDKSPYIQHCLETASILNKLNLDKNTIAASLLHDSIEETPYTLKDVKKDLGEEIYILVKGIDQIDNLMKNVNRNKAEDIIKMLVATTEDIRVLIIKLADRLHNMRTLSALNSSRRKRKAEETLSIYAPIAYRLGAYDLKWELEDLSLKHLHPKKYEEIRKKISLKREERELLIQKAIKELKLKLKQNNIKAKVYGRPKSFYSIFKKMEKNYSIEDIYDLLAIRIILENKIKCYESLGITHTLWQPMLNRFKDYIENPKENNYQSIHTGVLINNHPFEVQIRTNEMHEFAEEGMAAHWQYKGFQTEKKFDKQLSWLRQILDKSSLEKLKLDLFGDKIFCFTPQGDIIELPKNSTPVDFAFSVHSRVGERCNGARVNKKFVNLKEKLKTGDIVEILTKKDHAPSRDWLSFVKSSRALSKIRQSLRIQQGIPAKAIQKEDLIQDPHQNIIEVSGMKNAELKLANCCNPIPGDEIIGFITQSKKITIHNLECNKTRFIKRKEVEANWLEDIKSTVDLKITAIDRVGIFGDILNTISSTGNKVSLASVKISGDNIAECKISIDFETLQELRRAIDRIKRISDIKSVKVS